MKIQSINSVYKNLCVNEPKEGQYALQIQKPDTFERESSISFNGISAKGIVKQRGLLFHITSLPAYRSFCGQFGDVQTTKFINRMKAAKQTHWIMNPLNALEDNLCPYSSSGRFSRNKFIVNLNKLTGKEYGQFIKEQDKLWLDDYANYDVLSRRYGTYWPNWDKKLQTAPEDAKAEGITLKDKILQILDGKISKEEYEDGIGLYKFEQFLYNKQFNEMADELAQSGIRLMMDLPIGVSSGGVDVWGKKGIFLLGEDLKPVKVSGCPSEKAYPYTQVWGHALYNYDSPEIWEYQEASVKQLLRNADLRLDHFVGYVNRAAIPTVYQKADGTVLKGNDIFKPVEEGGMGTGFFDNSWIEDIYNKKSPKGENIIELFIRSARELGLKPEETYILEDFGPLAKTKLYKEFHKKSGKNFISQHVPVGMDICDSKNKKKMKHNIAILTGNHDMPPLREFVDKLMGNSTNKNLQKKFTAFCRDELQLTPDEIGDKEAVFENLMKWHYIQNVKQVQTTLQDALGIYFRPNIPGFWNGMKDKFLMKTTPEALLPYWNRVFPKDFLERNNESGINPGYKKLADKFIDMMKSLY